MATNFDLVFIASISASVKTSILVLGEPFRPEQQVGFPFIWSALVIVTIDALLARRARGREIAPNPVAEVS